MLLSLVLEIAITVEVFQHLGNWHVSKMLYLLMYLFHAAVVLRKGEDPLTASHPPYSSTGKEAPVGSTQEGPEKISIRDGESTTIYVNTFI